MCFILKINQYTVFAKASKVIKTVNSGHKYNKMIYNFYFLILLVGTIKCHNL